MAISKIENPREEGEFLHFITGTVKRIIIKDARNPKFATHDGSLIISDGTNEDVFVNIAINTKEGYEPRIQYAEGKKGSEKWFTLNQGDVVKLEVLPNEYNGKTYYKTTVSRIKVTSRAEAGDAKTSSGASKGSTKGSDYEPYDLIGVMTGHAVGGAARLMAKGAKGSLLELAEIVHTQTTELKQVVAEKTGLSVNSKNVGNSVGNAINAAIELYTDDKDTKAFLASKASEIYFEVSQVVYEHIKNATVTPKSTPETTKPKKETKPKAPVVQEPPMDFDDDIPF